MSPGFGRVMMKIIEVVPYWPAEVFVNRHIDALQGSEMEPKIITRKIERSVHYSSILRTEQDIEEFPHFDGLHPFLKIRKALSLLPDRTLFCQKRPWQEKVLLKHFKNEDPHLIHFHWADLAVRYAWIPLELGIPFTVSMRGSDIQVMSFDDRYLKKLFPTLMSANGIHSVSNRIWQLAIEICGKELTDKYHQTIYTTVPSKASPGLNVNNSPPYLFVTTCRLHWRKNLVSLLVAFNELIVNGLDARLIIIGDGPEKECLEYWIRFLNLIDRVGLIGTLTFPKICEIYDKADGYIQSSIAEGFSNATAEAMAYGLPVFATEIDGTNEIVKEDQNGYLLDPLHPEEWWRKLILVQDRQRMQRIRERAWNDARKTFSAQVHARQFIDFYRTSMKAG